MPVILCLLVLMPLAPVTGGGAASGPVAVMFYYGPEEYYWANATADGSADAVEVSKTAATNINRGFIYDDATGTVEIGGLRPGANDTWKWGLLAWDASGERWVPWTGNPHDLKPQAGGAIAWSPNTTVNPTPNPRSKYPWPMDKCSASRRGETLSPAPMTNLTYWSGRLNGSIYATPCVADGRIFVLAGTDFTDPVKARSFLVCLDEYNGTPIWRKEMDFAGFASSSPAYADGKVFVGGGDGGFRAFDARTGKILWTVDTDQSRLGVTSNPAVWNGKVFFTASDDFTYCLDQDGGLIWRSNVGAQGLSDAGGPAILGDMVVVGTLEGRLVCLQTGNGSQLWNITLAGPVVSTPALSSEGYAFVQAFPRENENLANMTLYSFFLRDAVQQWNATYPRSFSSPSISAGGLFLGTGSEIVGHHPDRGTKMWGIPFGEVDASPTVARGYVYFATNTPDGIIGCVGVSGNVVWTLRTGDPVFASPVVADGRLFVVTTNGTVLCLGRPPEPRVGAKLSVRENASVGSTVTVKAMLNNSGEAPALFTLQMTLDGNLTGPKKGPFTLQPGERMNVSFEWKALKGNHTLGLLFNGTNGTFTPATITVGKSAEACSSVIWTSALAAVALAAPSIVRWGRRKGP